jgi:transmembrane 9 superfamily member 2/4
LFHFHPITSIFTIGKMLKTLFLLFLIFEITLASLPGLDHKYYERGDIVEVKARKIVSNQALPFEYYSLKFCQPKPKKYSTESLGEVLFGDRIENSLYHVCLFFLKKRLK